MSGYLTIANDEGGTTIMLWLVPLTGLFAHWFRAGLRVKR